MLNHQNGRVPQVSAPDFIQIPQPVLAAPLPPSNKILFGYIYWYTKLALRRCTASNETLGKLTGLEPETVSNAVGKLHKAGFISVEYDGDPRSSKTKRTIDSLISYDKSVPLNNGTRQQGRVPLNNGTGATKILNKEEYIIRNRKEIENKKVDKAVENSKRASRTTVAKVRARLTQSGVLKPTPVAGSASPAA